MSRRQSRVSVDVRQNDTLLEFENFKKKFLLANKHITKLNSTLSVRIEELNAQISTLYVENLRLRASEIALASQLKREREKSRKIMADAEAATHSLMKHLGHLRKSFNVPHGRSSTPESPPPLRAQRPVINPNGTPPVNRIARPPSFPGITEDDEANVSSADEGRGAEEERDASPTPVKRRKTKPRPSTSRLPVPSRGTSPLPEADIPQPDLEGQLGKSGKRKPTRRQSGLLATMSITTVTPNGISTEVMPPRASSPAFGSPLRREVGLAEDRDETSALNGELDVKEEDQEEVEVILQSVSRRMKKDKAKDAEREEKEHEETTDRSRARDRDRKRARDIEDTGGSTSKSRLKDVTNSQRSRTSLLQLDTTTDRQHTPDNDPPTSATTTTSTSTTRTFLSTPATTPAPSIKQTTSLPTPRSSSPIPPAPSDSDSAIGGRERRVRKSINYAEPKLNTKMRKPDPPPGTTAKRTSRSSLERTEEGTSGQGSSSPVSRNESPSDIDPVPVVKRKKSRAYVPVEEDEESDGTQADAEFSSLRSSNTGGWANVDGRRRSVQSSSRRVEGDDVRRHSMAT